MVDIQGDLNWKDKVSHGLSFHMKYMHKRGRAWILDTAKEMPSKQQEIVSLLIAEARKLLLEDSNRDEVAARG